MNKVNCQGCHRKAALTKCFRGAFCKDCGQKCHPNFNHPLQFIIHAPPEQRIHQMKTSKSMGKLVSTEVHPPSRLSRVQSTLKTKRNLKQSQVHLQRPSREKTFSSNVSRKIRKQNELPSSRKQSVDKMKQSTKNAQNLSENIPKEIAIEKQDQEDEVQKLRKKVESQANLLKLFKQKLQAQKSKNKKMHLDYQQKLKLIRKMRC